MLYHSWAPTSGWIARRPWGSLQFSGIDNVARPENRCWFLESRPEIPTFPGWPSPTRITAIHVAWSISGGEDEEPYLVMICHSGGQPHGEPFKLDQIGVSHFSFTVDDVMGLAKELVAKGAEIPGCIKVLTNAEGKLQRILRHRPRWHLSLIRQHLRRLAIGFEIILPASRAPLIGVDNEEIYCGERWLQKMELAYPLKVGAI